MNPKCEVTNPIKKQFRISTLVFLKDAHERLLLIRRCKSPNQGKWSPIGGKLDQASGESPFECAIRETREETGFSVKESDLHLFAYVAEKNYENAGHWLMFLFACNKVLPFLPSSGQEGVFAVFDRSQIKKLDIPESDHDLIWPLYDKYGQGGFAAVRSDFTIPDMTEIRVEESCD